MLFRHIVPLSFFAINFNFILHSMSFRLINTGNTFFKSVSQLPSACDKNVHKVIKHTYKTHMQSKMGSNSFNFTVGLEPYCYKQFDQKQDNYIPCTKETFLKELVSRLKRGEAKLTDGYAPFCKHLFVENFTDVTAGYLPITNENIHLLRSGYVARTKTELPVLSRWFPKSTVEKELVRASYLDVILYSREQVIKENNARNEHVPEDDYDYYVVSIKPQNVEHEIPMLPITMFRNTMITEGGSGVPLDHEAYLKSVAFWQENAVVRDV
ncbi:hypothetical protein BBOV_III001670 [Babesia bovis T2Bo]|uniref:hypothetical protein n=1 Tax=Babesia bovis T2Bo TaxID=484906 RepID=UPI001C35103D|nr:hypothetical protein BBOV_III001670 [Babesia bovis T2Bo]EDO07734.2 hypothetical protein BBOV_III001670 [Babesia bovis T2Bo]